MNVFDQCNEKKWNQLKEKGILSTFENDMCMFAVSSTTEGVVPAETMSRTPADRGGTEGWHSDGQQEQAILRIHIVGASTSSLKSSRIVVFSALKLPRHAAQLFPSALKSP